MLYITIEEWENIPQDYKIKANKKTGCPAYVLAGCIEPGGGTKLLQENLHFKIIKSGCI